MNEFLAECRREWKRLGVPRSAIEDMTEELSADLHEASLEEALGRDARDAKAFARSWAVERDVVPERRRRWPLAVLAALALASTIAGAVLLAHDREARPSGTALIAFPAGNAPAGAWVAADRADALVVTAQAAAAQESAIDGRLVRADESTDGRQADTIALMLLFGGLVVLVAATLLSSHPVALRR